MKVVLALAPVWDSQTPPLALAFLKSSLAQAGYDCTCIDFSIQFRPMMVSALGDVPAEEYIASHPELYKNWAKQIADQKPDIVGFSLLVSNTKNTALVAKEVKNLLPNVVIVSGGPSLTRENQDNIEQVYKFSDYIIEGEGENLLVDFVKCIEEKGDIHKVKQVWLQKPDGSVYYTGAGMQQNINTIPLPDFTDFDVHAYPCNGRLPILFSRGCILNCNYCENKWNHLTQRTRHGRLVFEELKRNVKQYSITEYMFNDDSLISHVTFKQLEEYCDLTIAEDLVMPWSVYGTRVEKMLTQPYVDKLRRSGMSRVSLGVESFSTDVQHAMGKSSRYDDADKTCRLFGDAGIKTESWIIYGYPTETDKNFEETLNWFIQNPNVLSHVTANTFGPNAKYLHDRPGMIKYLGNKQWNWASEASTLQKRKERFLLLIDVLETTRKARKGNFSYHFGDPLYVKYFTTWTKQDKEFLLDCWAELEGTTVPPTGFKKVLHLLGIEKKNTRYSKYKSMVHHNDTLELEITGTADELREKLLEKIKNHLQKANGRSVEEQEQLAQTYIIKVEEIATLTSPTVTGDIVYAMALRGSLAGMLAELDSCSAEELSGRIIEQIKMENVKAMKKKLPLK
ncbi:MAG: radical SAM protein [Bacteroidetes bacterium]|nr:radical SAM protein [Bacteroidota bacterium]